MKIKTQSDVLAKIEAEARVSIRKVEDKHLTELLKLWDKTKDDLRRDIMATHHKNHRSEPWDYAGSVHTRYEIQSKVRERVGWFLRDAEAHFQRAMNAVYNTETSYALWLLDQTTPDSIHPRRPIRTPLMEAKREAGKDLAGWSTRLQVYAEGYVNNLAQNINLGAINGSSIADATDEVDATRVGTPAYDMADMLERLFTTGAIALEAEARDAVSDANADIVEEEIWQTMMDADVCPICDDNAGATRDEADEDIPAHPNDRCFWRIVPKAYADLLSSGDDNDRALAKQMDDDGLPIDAMAIRDDNGDLVGKIIVSFDSWSDEMANITAGVQ